MSIAILSVVVVLYLMIMGGLAYYGYRKTLTTDDYLVAGRDVHPVVMALSYGATFISTSALVGFGGVAGLFGFSLLWLTFLNIFLGILIAFALFGVRIRKMASIMEISTFPSLLGERYQSKFITFFSGLMIFIFMPAYTSIILIGGARFVEEALHINFDIALFLLAVIVGAYVITGGLKAVMYTDALGASIMLVGMIILLFTTYYALGGISDAHLGLSAIADKVPASLQKIGHQGWMSMPEFGSQLWWTVVSTIVMGVGIGVLAQPQLAMRFMTVRHKRSLNRAILVGGIFIFFMTGTAFIVGSLSNLFFFNEEGKIAIQMAQGNSDKIIPIFIRELMPPWFMYVFMLTLVSAAVSTLSSLIHVQGTALSRDILNTVGIKVNRKAKEDEGGLGLIRIGVLVGTVAAIFLAYILPGGVIARATAFWFGICAAGFLPSLIGALYWRKATRAGAAASIVVGYAVSIFGFLFLHLKESSAFGISQAIFGKDALLSFPWTYIDPLIYALPISGLVFVIVSLMTESVNRDYIDNIYDEVNNKVSGG